MHFGFIENAFLLCGIYACACACLSWKTASERAYRLSGGGLQTSCFTNWPSESEDQTTAESGYGNPQRERPAFSS